MEIFELVSVWQANRAAGWSVQQHRHTYYELVYYAKGSGTSQVGDNLYRFGSGNFILLPPGTAHNEHHGTEGSVICLGFHSGTPLAAALHTDQSQTVLEILQDIMQEAAAQSVGYKTLLSARLTELCIRVLRLQQCSTVNTKNFEYIIRYLEENYHEKLLLSDCAQQLNLSYDYFQHRFKQLTGLSPQAFLLQQRLNAAKQLLQTSNLSCTEIACRCGFSTSAQFSMQFKRAFHLSPLQYKHRV